MRSIPVLGALFLAAAVLAGPIDHRELLSSEYASGSDNISTKPTPAHKKTDGNKSTALDFLRLHDLADLMKKNLSEWIKAEVLQGSGPEVYKALHSVLRGDMNFTESETFQGYVAELESETFQGYVSELGTFLMKFAMQKPETKEFIRCAVEVYASFDGECSVSKIRAAQAKVERAALALSTEALEDLKIAIETADSDEVRTS
uniref:DUF148 domain-containing protein n=1 Tax=Steinernema glaseri TaxID=37863 RepID=A0A1I8AX04_9BILA